MKQQKVEGIITAKGKHNRPLFLIFLGVLFLHPGCGRKAPPVAPQVVVPPAVKDLRAEVVGHDVQLTWSVPTQGDTVFEGVKGFRIFRYESRDSSTPRCPGCPIRFHEHLDIKLTDPAPARIKGGRVICRDALEPGCRYAYKVVVYHKSGGVSGNSNIVEFATEP